MSQTKNILFIMCDQLRWDYLSCYGHPHLQTPNIDWLAENGVRFERAYIQSPVCGPSRACIYTGRYQTTLGVRHNGYPVRLDELGLGDYLAEVGVKTAVVGKTDLHVDPLAAQRLGVDLRVENRKLLGIEDVDEDSGNHPTKMVRQRGEQFQYNDYLRGLGYDGENPWHTHANSTVDEAGNVLDGWYNRHVKYPANIREEHSQTPYTTNRALEFLQNVGEQPWCLHVGYIKPHWPYVAPAPYHNMYSAAQMLPANRTEAERDQPHHPVYEGFLRYTPGEGFSRDEIRETVVPVYMGLVKQVDDQIGRLLAWLRENGQLDQTMIVFTSDHGDYLGDHWLTDKYWFHEEVIRVPLLIYDPSPAANATRGTVCDALVESIDLVPTMVEYCGGTPSVERLEGRSLLPLLHGEEVADWRDYVICEEDYSPITVRAHLDLAVDDARATMIRTKRWKYIVHERFRPELYDMAADPQERCDLGVDPNYEGVRRELHEQLFRWFRRRKLRLTRTHAFTRMRSQPGWVEEMMGVMIGYW